MSKGDALVVDDFTNHPSIHAIADNNTLQTEFNFVPVEVAYVNDILNKLNPRKAVGCDSISQRLLRISAPVISLPLTNLINHFITNRVRPIVWRSSNMIHVFKTIAQYLCCLLFLRSMRE